MAAWDTGEVEQFETHVTTLIDDQGIGHLTCPRCVHQSYELLPYPAGLPDEGLLGVSIGAMRVRAYALRCNHCGLIELYDEAVASQT